MTEFDELIHSLDFYFQIRDGGHPYLLDINDKLDRIIGLLEQLTSTTGAPQNAPSASGSSSASHYTGSFTQGHTQEQQISRDPQRLSVASIDQLLKEKSALEDDIKIYQRLNITIPSPEYLEKIDELKRRIAEIDKVLNL